MSETDRFMRYIGDNDVAKVEEHPFQEGQIACMILTEGHLKGRRLSPETAREMAEALNTAADKVERAQDTGTDRTGGGADEAESS